MLNLRQLQIFRELIQCQTTVSVAQSLGLSQPTVSNAIKHMESQLGFALFERSGNRLVPTQEAMDIYRDSEPIFKMMLSFSRRLADVRDTRVGSLRLLATPPIANAVVPSALRSFKSTRPDVSVTFDVHRTDGVIDGVESGRADLGVSLEPYMRPGLEFELIGTGQMVCAFQPGHPIGANHEISEDVIRSYPLICYASDTRFGSLLRREFFNEPPSEGSIEVQYSYTACLLAEAGLGVALVDSFTSIHGSRYKIDVRPLRPGVSVDAYVIYQKSRAPKRLVRAFIDQLKLAIAELA
ncbi:LysR family transcriptional regulator [Methylobacterium sp. SyP6R]|uniref:LysR family transcriptional regulator n=1 Tax=Methylobacterium sp. SyP6R TaxID=2718876 RepID=UPI001F368241|nr:LysR substrate-binding domain-containing protein [Methylobacterium sp. SyP6R]MCF4130002.1 LysR substrate-binding domain-containing protein [Methylobacterium sp. SyP6R]